MTIEEMHIAVNLGVQKIASFQVDNLLPQEIDHELNDAMESFIKQRYNPMGNKYRKGFEQSQKRVDDLRALVVDGRIKCFYAGESISGFYIDRAPLPNDYMFLINALSDNYYECNAAVSYGTATYTYKAMEVSLTPPVEGYVLKSIGIDNTVFVSDDNGMSLEYVSNANNYSDSTSSLNLTKIAPAGSNPKTLTVQVTTGTSYNLTDLANSETTPTSDSNKLVLLIDSEIYGNTANVKATWVSPINSALTAEVDYPFANIIEQPVTYRVYTAGAGTRQRENMSFVQHDDLYSLLSDPFNTTTYDKIKYTIQENFIDVHSDETFFTTFVDIKYIRQPKRMDKSLGVGCELAPHTHNEIVEMAVQSILEAISDPRYNTQSREVLGSE